MSTRCPIILRRYRTNSRQGTATLEFAACLPLLVTIFLATIDCCSMISLQETLAMAAFEGGRVAGIRGTTTADVRARCNEMITSRGLSQATVTTAPSEIAAAPPGQLVEVRLVAPCDSVGVFFGPFYHGRNAEARFTCVRQLNSP